MKLTSLAAAPGWQAEVRLGISPRAVYELLFFDYMGLTETDLPVGRARHP